MRILFITVRADLGGGPEHLYQLLTHAPTDIEAFVACPNDEPYWSRYSTILGADHVTEIPHRSFHLTALLSLIQIVRQCRIDVVHSHGKGAGLYGRLIALLTKARSVHTFHGLHVGEYGSLKKTAYLALERILGRMTSAAICVSASEAAAIQQARFLPQERLVTIANGVDSPASVHAREISHSLPILAVNRFDHQKNPDLLIDIAQQLRAMRDFTLTVLGTGEKIDLIRQRIRAKCLEQNVFILGGVADVRPFMRRSVVFLSTSRWEGMPLAVLEAMSEGMCVVATDVAGNNDVVVHNETGLLFSDAKTAANQIALLNEMSVKRLSLRARHLVERAYSAQAMAHSTFRLLRDVARSQSSTN